jgi:hypothetical protein
MARLAGPRQSSQGGRFSRFRSSAAAAGILPACLSRSGAQRRPALTPPQPPSLKCLPRPPADAGPGAPAAAHLPTLRRTPALGRRATVARAGGRRRGPAQGAPAQAASHQQAHGGGQAAEPAGPAGRGAGRGGPAAGSQRPAHPCSRGSPSSRSTQRRAAPPPDTRTTEQKRM